MSFSWMSGLFQGRSPEENRAIRRPIGGRQSSRSARGAFKPQLQALEDRLVPAVNVLQNVPGVAFDTTTDPNLNVDQNFRFPAEPSIAVGVNRIVEAVNSSVLVLDKSGGVISQSSLFDVYNPGNPLFLVNGNNLAEQVVYDDTTGRFVFFMIQQTGLQTGVTARIWYAVSNNSTPNSFALDFGNFNEIDVAQTSITGNNVALLPVDLRVGFNRDGVYVTSDLITEAASATAIQGAYDSTLLISITKGAFYNGGIADNQFQLNNLNYGMAPAQMHNAPAGAPEIFVGTNGLGDNGTPFGSGSLRVTFMSFPTSANAQFRTVSVGVANYGNGPLPNAPQAGNILDTYDTAITNVDWRNNSLVTDLTANVGGRNVVRWYQISVANNGASLTQTGSIDGGPGVATYFPRIALSIRGDIGIVYDQSSNAQFMSTYVTGRAAADPLNTLQTPVLIQAGTAVYADPSGPPFEPGQYNGIGFDPASPNNFYSIGLWASSAQVTTNWSTQIANFNLSAVSPSQIRLFSPLRFVYNAATATYIGNVAVVNTQDIVNGTFILVFNIPNPSITMIAPGGVTNPVTNQFLITFVGTFTPGEVLRFPIEYTTPQKIPVPTFYLSGFFGII
jgi:hypothetical protein